MKTVERNQYFKQHRRAGLAERVINLIAEYQDSMTYKRAIELAGRMAAIEEVCKADSYWGEKSSTGRQLELEWLDNHESKITEGSDGLVKSVSFCRIDRE